MQARTLMTVKLSKYSLHDALMQSRQHLFFTRTAFLSWCVFWIGADKLPERVSICIALILAQLILIVGAEQEFPNTSDFKLVDLYLIVNFFINSAALLETLLASIVPRAIKKFKSACLKRKGGAIDVSEYMDLFRLCPPPPSLVAPPDARAIFLHNDLISNGSSSVIGGRITCWGGA